jgi:lysyl-tRNA synthetase class 2
MSNKNIENVIQDNVVDESEQIHERREKLTKLRQKNNAYPNFFKKEIFAEELHTRFDHLTEEDLTKETQQFSFAGRIMLKRVMGKAMFMTAQDMTGRIQLYLRQDILGEETFDDLKTWDIGDIIGARGQVFKTKTGELSLKVQEIFLLCKSLRPLPDKFHGLSDQELRYRQRYLDLLMNPDTRQVFTIRSHLINEMRQFLRHHHFVEVETPMMQVLAGGAAAKPFVTHHHALDMEMYLRIAPELYLKRLVVGGMERVFELNRNFRNEGVSTRHNPEFTMVEFYQAYADYQDFMDFTEKMLQTLAQTVLHSQTITYQEMTIDFAKPFQRMTLIEAILHYHPQITLTQLTDEVAIRELAQKFGIHLPSDVGIGKIQLELFEKTVESKLIAPTFITAYPTEVSPLARCNDQNSSIVDRFELFIAGREIANGFSELNDPDDQAARFRLQMQHKNAGDEEAMPYDEDYIKALEYGLPPTAGAGIGIDRLVMLFTNQPSIRDVLLFPHMRGK